MKTILLSLKAPVFNNVHSGKKIFEHRKCFPDEPIKAYIYVSSPVKAISGILYLSNKTSLHDLRKKYEFDQSCVSRIDDYLNRGYQYVMQIDKYIATNEIKLDCLRKELSKFVVPQMYYFIDNTDLLTYLNNNLLNTGYEINNTFDHITSNMICIN